MISRVPPKISACLIYSSIVTAIDLSPKNPHDDDEENEEGEQGDSKEDEEPAVIREPDEC
jgi:hypothetical protein